MHISWPSINHIYQIHLHLYIIVIITLSEVTPFHHTEAECWGKDVTSSNMLRLVRHMKIYICNLVALVNILRLFCNTVDLLLSSSLHRQQQNTELFENKVTKRELTHIHIFINCLWLSLSVSHYGIVWYEWPLQRQGHCFPFTVLALYGNSASDSFMLCYVKTPCTSHSFFNVVRYDATRHHGRIHRAKTQENLNTMSLPQSSHPNWPLVHRLL